MNTANKIEKMSAIWKRIGHAKPIYEMLELTDKQIDRIKRILDEREAKTRPARIAESKRIAAICAKYCEDCNDNRKNLCSYCDEWSDTKLREVPDDSGKICQECFDDNYFECFDCEEVQSLQDEDYHKIAHPDIKGKLVCICEDCNDNRKNIGACGNCAKWFDEGKDFCKCCGFDLNSYNQSEEE